MSTKTQENNMKRLGELLAVDLGYIFGERESGPNGEKKEFLSKGRAFLSALGKDLGFAVYKVRTNPAGIAVSGEVTLMGMWADGNGLYLCLEEPIMSDFCVLYRTIRNMKDYSGGQNCFLSRSLLSRADYSAFIMPLLRLKQEATHGKAA